MPVPHLLLKGLQTHSQLLQGCWQDAGGCFGEQGRGLQSADLLQGILNAVLDCLALMELK